jgi:hypothetical protein
MAFAKPKDGYAYSAIELTGLAHIPVDKDEILAGLARRGAFFKFAEDYKNARLVIRAIVAEFLDNPPAFEPDMSEGDVQC